MSNDPDQVARNGEEEGRGLGRRDYYAALRAYRSGKGVAGTTADGRPYTRVLLHPTNENSYMMYVLDTTPAYKTHRLGDVISGRDMIRGASKCLGWVSAIKELAEADGMTTEYESSGSAMRNSVERYWLVVPAWSDHAAPVSGRCACQTATRKTTRRKRA